MRPISATDLKLIESNNSDKMYFQQLNELSYRELVMRQFGSWDKEKQKLAFEQKWQESAFKKIMYKNVMIGGI